MLHGFWGTKVLGGHAHTKKRVDAVHPHSCPTTPLIHDVSWCINASDHLNSKRYYRILSVHAANRFIDTNNEL